MSLHGLELLELLLGVLLLEPLLLLIVLDLLLGPSPLGGLLKEHVGVTPFPAMKTTSMNNKKTTSPGQIQMNLSWSV